MLSFLKSELVLLDQFDRLANHVLVSAEQLPTAVHGYPAPSAIQCIHDENIEQTR